MVRHTRAPRAFWIAVMVAAVLNPLNSSTLSVAMPLLLRVLHTPAAGITWIISAYYLGSAVAQPMMGKLGDHWGQRRLITGGLTLVVVSAIGAPLSRFAPGLCLMASFAGDWHFHALSQCDWLGAAPPPRHSGLRC